MSLPLIIAAIGGLVVAMTLVLHFREAFQGEDPTYTPIPATAYALLAICTLLATVPSNTENNRPRPRLPHPTMRLSRHITKLDYYRRTLTDSHVERPRIQRKRTQIHSMTHKRKQKI